MRACLATGLFSPAQLSKSSQKPLKIVMHCNALSRARALRQIETDCSAQPPDRSRNHEAMGIVAPVPEKRDMDGVADDIGGALLALGSLGHGVIFAWVTR